MIGFLKLLGKISSVSNAVTTVIHDNNVEVRKKAIVNIIMTSLSILEDKMKRDIANDDKVKIAAEKLADAVFSAIDIIE